MRIENYKQQLEEADRLYSSIKHDLVVFKVPADTGRIEYLLGTIGGDIDDFRLDDAYNKLTELLQKLNDAQSMLQAKKAAVLAANSSIADAEAALAQVKNLTGASAANTTAAEQLISSARKALYDDPAAAKKYADDATALLRREAKSAEDTSYLTLVSAVTVIFISIVVVLVGLGIYQLIRKRKPWH
ncbi:MAG: hypothetical protein N3G76_03215 [Candidatus Micrarchaeota archaeon]|nr:hypothetical protein [Candidatus Micrarchaeota archaeon]